MKDEDFLKKLLDLESRVKYLTHRKKTDVAYFQAREIANDLMFLLGGNDFRLDEKILDKYNLRGSDKSKNEVLEEFKNETLFDLRQLINRQKPSDPAAGN